MATALPKQYLSLLDRPIISWTLDTFLACERIASVHLVLSADDAHWQAHATHHPKLSILHCGGETRAETVLNALKSLDVDQADWVLVHDAARPGLTHTLLDSLLDEVQDDAVGGLLAIPVADTLKRADASQRVKKTESREDLWQAQTPQMFQYGLLKRALINNFDVRYELYPTAGEIFSATAFYKNFKDPIEAVYLGGSNRTKSFLNVKSAVNYGIELEFRKKLNFLNNFNALAWEGWDNFTIATNFARIESSVDLRGNPNVQDSIRPLQGQSPYLINSSLSYYNTENAFGATILYNVIGRRIREAGFLGYENIVSCLQTGSVLFNKEYAIM